MVEFGDDSESSDDPFDSAGIVTASKIGLAASALAVFFI